MLFRSMRYSINYLLKKLGFNIENKSIKSEMNPYEYWYKNNDDIRSYIDSYYKIIDNLSCVSENLKNDLKYLFENGSVSEKFQVMSVIEAYKQWFN